MDEDRAVGRFLLTGSLPEVGMVTVREPDRDTVVAALAHRDVDAQPAWLGAEQGGGDDSDAVAAAVGLRAGGDYCGVEQVVADLSSQPVEVADVVVGDRA